MRKLSTAALEARADAFFDLEEQVYHLRNMILILDMLADQFSASNRDSNGKLTIEVSPYELDMFHFAVADVVRRSADLKTTWLNGMKRGDE